MDGLLNARAPSPEAYAATTIDRLRTQRLNLGTRTPGLILASALHGLKAYFCDRGIIRRYLDGNVAQLREAVDTAARMGFLMYRAGGREYSSYDCSHIFDLLLALAVDDRPLVAAFLKHFPGPFHSGHPATVLLSNGVYAVLLGDRSGFATLEQSLRSKSESKFFRAMFDCLLAIAADNGPQVAAALAEMVKLNRRQEQLNSSMQKLICLTAHAFFNVCRNVFLPRAIPLPAIPDEGTWDGEFQALVQASDSDQNYFNFSSVNSVLVQWMQDLPADVTLEELLT